MGKAMTRSSSHNNDRLRRADSWLAQSEQVSADDEKFIFLWIAFNAAYGDKPRYENPYKPEPSTSRNKFHKFLREILHRDYEGKITTILSEKYLSAKSIRRLLQNQYVFEPFWMSVRGEPSTQPWEEQLAKRNERVFKSHPRIGDQDPQKKHVLRVLEEVLTRLNTLRNQIFHGGTTFATGMGRKQLKDGCNIMEALIPVILEIMRADIKAHPESDAWGTVAYPVVPRRLDDDGNNLF